MGSPFISATGTDAGTIQIVGRPPLPNLVVADFKAKTGLGDVAEPEQVLWGLRSAQLSISTVIAAWLGQRGDAPLTEDETDLYLQAVYTAARAMILSLLRDYDATKSGEAKADRLNPEIDTLMAQSHTALNHLMGQGRATVRLI